ncbi:MAG: NAD(P)H-dependent oxidoreductase [Clostridia bacterium]|nr:NAD(P)H-dependent oxidoreductase [Clostridia bacterium]
MKTLIAYFSAGGVTAALASRLAEAAQADLFEIRPEAPYSPADLRWTNPLARCNREKIGKKDVPYVGRADAAAYDLVLLGFPIWYYAAPNIIETFLKQTDLTGKKIALFATSGGSEMGKTAAKLQPLTKGEIIDAKRFAANADQSALQQWLAGLNK